MAKTGRQSFQQMVRLPDDLRDRLKAEADTAGRSLNAEIVLRLEQSFDALPTPRELTEFIQQDVRYKEWVDPVLKELEKNPGEVRRVVDFLDILDLDVSADIHEWKDRSHTGSDEA